MFSLIKEYKNEEIVLLRAETVTFWMESVANHSTEMFLPSGNSPILNLSVSPDAVTCPPFTPLTVGFLLASCSLLAARSHKHTLPEEPMCHAEGPDL